MTDHRNINEPHDVWYRELGPTGSWKKTEIGPFNKVKAWEFCNMKNDKHGYGKWVAKPEGEKPRRL